MTGAAGFGGGLEVGPGGAGALGGDIGAGIGRWGGRILGGALGELFGPEAVIPGAMLGGRLGAYLGQMAGSAAGEWLANHMGGASDEADKSKDAAANPAVTCATCGRRSKPNQTCDDDVLERLEAAKDQVCSSIFTNQAFRSGNKRRLAQQSCADIRARLQGMRACRDARQKIQDECFAGNTDASHEQAMKELDNGIANLEQLEAQNCASPPLTS